ncbi:flagellar protein FliT [Marinobacter xestospongiae]|uniref:Flagellar protein FliT n=1 Tax=Marinobacter xestospongiae TaxID=994319 RepID=A0ABU3VTN9_9GAMM|nr:flagellar protein FliT [Marinobacter xestospongiae]MDV2077638.1 SOS cell division inhibitor [Marinobacter xestospongiae]
MANSLEQLDTLMDAIRHALTQQDWEAIAKLDAEVRPVVDQVMASHHDGDLSMEVVHERLEQLQALCDDARAGAETARAEAKAGLDEMRQTRNATRAYQDISGR